MDPKVIFLVVCLSFLAVTFTDAGIPKCCIRTRNLNPRKLWKIQRLDRQYSSGACDIDALVVFMKGEKTPSCLHIKHEKFLKWHLNKSQKRHNEKS